jgi:hypothetical protein
MARWRSDRKSPEITHIGTLHAGRRTARLVADSEISISELIVARSDRGCDVTACR